MKRTYDRKAFLPALGLLIALALSDEARPEPPDLDVNALLRHLSALGDDVMEGRGTGTAGGERAAKYIENELRKLGLEPGGKGGSFRQPVPLHGSLPLPESRLTLVGPGASRHVLDLWDDYVLFDSGAETLLPQPTSLVFMAYGIVAPEYDYNDYQRTDVAGRIVVVLAGEPPSSNPAFFQGPRPTVYSDPEMKFRTAFARGARGVVLIPSPREEAFLSWNRTLDDFQTEDVTLPYGWAGNLNVLLHLEAAARLFNGSRRSIADILEDDSQGALGTFPLAVRMSFVGRFRERDFIAHNLIARLPGSDPLLRRDHVIVVAHYDHLGRGRPKNGDDIYNGVVDNASGTAAVLELARALATSEARPRRSILFLLVTGEEKGLLGSRHYRDHPVVPLHRTVAAINVDGLSFLDSNDEFVGIGAEFSTLGALLEETLTELGLRRAEIPTVLEWRQPFYDSDQLAFAQAGIPSILVMEGFAFRNLSPEEGLRRFIAWGRDRYHSPFDDLEQPLDRAAIEQHGRVLLAFVRRTANTPIEPRWLPGAPWIAERLSSLAEGR